jgi:hypothetical protein
METITLFASASLGDAPVCAALLHEVWRDDDQFAQTAPSPGSGLVTCTRPPSVARLGPLAGALWSLLKRLGSSPLGIEAA